MHRATDQFWRRYWGLPKEVQSIADKNFQILKNSPRHTSLQLKKIQNFWSVRVGLAHRALAIEDGNDFIWVWIGSHDEYEKMIKKH
jgi:hypothetical protein